MLIFVLTLFTLIAFAANSLLCRMALGGALIDPVSFTTLRLLSGALILIPIARFRAGPIKTIPKKRIAASALALFVYAAAFSLAYVTLDTGVGALILFGAVQATMIGSGLISGERPHPLQWLGLSLALGGLIFLVFPGLTAPDPLGALLMVVSGIAWGIYSVRGRKAYAPVAATAANFTGTLPLALLAIIIAFPFIQIDQIHAGGILLAVISGSVTSGLGYVLWYKALKGLSTTLAAIVQLLVPVIAAFGGVLLLAEVVSARLIVASILILGGVAMAVIRKQTGSLRAPLKSA